MSIRRYGRIRSIELILLPEDDWRRRFDSIAPAERVLAGPRGEGEVVIASASLGGVEVGGQPIAAGSGA